MDAIITTPRLVVGHYPIKGKSAGRRTVLLRPTEGRIISLNADMTTTLIHEETGARFTVPSDIVDVA